MGKIKQVLKRAVAIAGLAAAAVVHVAPTVIADVAKLRDKKLAAAVVGFAIAAIAPLGINAGPSGSAITGAVVLVATVCALLEKLSEHAAPKPPPK